MRKQKKANSFIIVGNNKKSLLNPLLINAQSNVNSIIILLSVEVSEKGCSTSLHLVIGLGTDGKSDKGC